MSVYPGGPLNELLVKKAADAMGLDLSLEEDLELVTAAVFGVLAALWEEPTWTEMVDAGAFAVEDLHTSEPHPVVHSALAAAFDLLDE